MKRFNLYQRLPKDLTEATYSGALLSLICTLIILLLAVTEIHKFLSLSVTSDMLVDVSHGYGRDRITINLDIVFYKMPCEVLTLDVQDIMGMHIADVRGDMIRRKMDKNGKQMDDQPMFDVFHETNQEFIEHIGKQLDDGEGCHIFGHFDINRAPGMFRISTHARN